MDCRDSALFTGVDEASCENMLRCFSAYEQRFSAGQTILTCGEQQDMIGVLLSGSAALLRLHADGNRTVLESMDEGSVFGEELAFTGFRDGSALIECREDCRVIFMRYDQITKRCENACAHHSRLVENMFHIIRAFHVAGRCTDCGECSRVCPQGIPLHLFNRKFIKDIDELYGEYQAGEDTDSKGPLTNFTFDDAEPSIVTERG